MERSCLCLTTKELTCSPSCIRRFLVQLLVLHPLSFQPLEGCGDPENTAGEWGGLVRELDHLLSVVVILCPCQAPWPVSEYPYVHCDGQFPPGAPDFAPMINPKPQPLVSALGLGSLKSWRSCCPWMTPEINEKWGLLSLERPL